MLVLALFAQLAQASPPDSAGGMMVRVAPESVLVERETGSAQGYVNFDFLVSNRTAAPTELRSVVVTARDGRGEVVLRRFCDTSGISPCIETVPGRVIDAGGTGIVYNPFPVLPTGVPVDALRYELVFADSAGTRRDTVRVAVPIHEYRVRTALVLPVRGRLLVFDGHDLYAHHRRWNLAHPIIQRLFTGNPGRYAYDLSIVDAAGRMYWGDGSRNEDWYSWGAPVVAPGAGTVVAAAGDEPDWEVGATSLPDSVVLARPIALFGNYVTIDHGNGEYSVVAHLQRGSVAVRPGDTVRQGSPIGRVGFSGSVYTIHTHYQLQRGRRYDAEGLPSYFGRVVRIGAAGKSAGPLRIDSGDVVESR